MSMPLTLGGWNEWSQQVTGTGAIVNSGAGLACTGGTGIAKAYRYFAVRPGEIVRFSSIARVRVGGSVAANQGLGISIWKPGVGVLVSNYKLHEFNDFAECEVCLAVPLNAPNNCYAVVEVGSSSAATVDFILPKVSIGEAIYGASRRHALAMFTWNSGTGQFGLSANTAQAGITGLSYNAGTKTFTVTMEPVAASVGVAPVCFAQLSASPLAPGLIAKVGAFNAVAGTVAIQFYDTVSNAIVDLATIASLALDMHFKAEI